MSRRRYFEEQRSGNGAIYHCYVFMFSNNYDGKSDLIQNADEDVDCMTYAQDTSLYSNDSFFVFV